MEYVIETKDGLEYTFQTDEVEHFDVLDAANVAVRCYDPDLSAAFPNVQRWFLRESSP
jgi:hypothetical protein